MRDWQDNNTPMHLQGISRYALKTEHQCIIQCIVLVSVVVIHSIVVAQWH